MPLPSPDKSYLPGLPHYLSFADEAGHSRDPQRHCLCLAALVAPEEKWQSFDAEWRTACEEEGLARPFHMMHLAARKEAFKGWSEQQRRRLLQKLVSAISRANVIPIGSVVMLRGPDALPEAVQTRFRDAYLMAFQSLTYHVAVAASMMDPRTNLGPGPVTMVYSHHPEHSRGAANTEELWKAFRKHNRIIATWMQSYLSETPQNCTPLQAADLWAYELGHHFECIRPFNKRPRWPFEQLVKLGMNYAFTHDFISYHGANGEDGIGRMSCVKRWREIDLYRPGIVPRIPPGADSLLECLKAIAIDERSQRQVVEIEETVRKLRAIQS